MTANPLDVQAVCEQLRVALQHGACAAQLARHTPGLVDLLRPGGTAADLLDRAFSAEQAIRDAVDALDAPADAAMRIMLCLAPGTRHTGKEQRRRRAADLMGMTAGNFRRPHVEGVLLFDLAVELYRSSAA